MGLNLFMDVVIAVPQSNHRKSKFGLRHGIHVKLDELYAMTKTK